MIIIIVDLNLVILITFLFKVAKQEPLALTSAIWGRQFFRDRHLKKYTARTCNRTLKIIPHS